MAYGKRPKAVLQHCYKRTVFVTFEEFLNMFDKRIISVFEKSENIYEC